MRWSAATRSIREAAKNKRQSILNKGLALSGVLNSVLRDERGPFQVIFGEDASLSPVIVLPIALVVFVVFVIIALRLVLKDKGKSEMTAEELEEDRALFDARMQRQADYNGTEYIPELARVAEAEEISEANRRQKN